MGGYDRTKKECDLIIANIINSVLNVVIIVHSLAVREARLVDP